MNRTIPKFAGFPISELSGIAGDSPTYVYSKKIVKNNIEQLICALPDSVSLHYSLKANPHPQIASYIATLLNGFDVSSHSELITAIGTGIERSEISFSGPGKTDAELIAAISAGVTIHLESQNELSRIYIIANDLKIQPKLTIRINPDFLVRQSGMVMGGGSQPFGIDLELVPGILELISTMGFTCNGMHCYAGSQILDANVVSDLHKRTLEMMAAIPFNQVTSNLSFNIGGGYGIPYSSGHAKLDINTVGQRLFNLIEKFGENVCSGERNFKIVVELGRYIVGDAGIYITKVIDKKISRDKVYLVVNGGMNHHLAATGNLGQAIQRNYPLKSSSTCSEDETVTIVGPLCTPLDILANNVCLPKSNIGDFIILYQSGAYGFTASPHNFLSHPPPKELVL